MSKNEKYISVDAFMSMLKNQNLVIGKAEDFEAVKQVKLNNLRKRYMRRTALSISEILEAELLPLNSRTSVEHWITSGKIKPHEVIVETTGKKKRLILTQAIERLGYGC